MQPQVCTLRQSVYMVAVDKIIKRVGKGGTEVKAAGRVFTVVRTCRMVSMCQRWEGAYLTDTHTHKHIHTQWCLKVSQALSTHAWAVFKNRAAPFSLFFRMQTDF